VNKKMVSCLGCLLFFASLCNGMPGARVVERNGYPGCVELFNDKMRVVLEPNWGGRVLAYSLNGVNALYVDPNQNGHTLSTGKRLNPCGGRFDIGPEKITPQRDILWQGKWTAEITGSRSARMVSQVCPNTGVQLIRVFELSPKSSHLKCTQIIKNRMSTPQRYCHWSRTFAVGGGICLVPLSKKSRYPLGYLLYGPGEVLDFQPASEPNIRVRDRILEILGLPSRPKFAIDCDQGWIAYVIRTNHLFIKTFEVDPERSYGEMAANNVSIWYNDNRRCEIEPIGPWSVIDPDRSISYTEHWWLFDFPYPDDKTVDLNALKRMVNSVKRLSD
jgi:hypothetical protein